MKDWLEIRFWRMAIWLIKRGYGADCTTRDMDDVSSLPKEARCGSCYAKETLAWIDQHIDLLSS